MYEKGPAAPADWGSRVVYGLAGTKLMPPEGVPCVRLTDRKTSRNALLRQFLLEGLVQGHWRARKQVIVICGRPGGPLDLIAVVCPAAEVELASHVESVRSAIPHQPDDVLFLAGSHVEGLSNGQSDVDVIILEARVEDETRLHSAEGGRRTGRVLRLPVVFDLEYVPMAQVKRMAGALQPREGDRPSSEVDWYTYKFMHRLRTGVAVGHEYRLEQVRRMFDFSYFRRVQYVEAIAAWMGYRYDAIGAIDKGDAGTAFLTGRLALEKAMMALLHARGETNPNCKWLFRLIERQFRPDDQALLRFRALYTGAALRADSAEAMLLWAQESLDQANYLIRMADHAQEAAASSTPS